jgi:ankyrin repeat protein
MKSGLKLQFIDRKSLSTIKKWAIITDKNDGVISYALATSREKEVVIMVNKGKWSYQSYVDYQIFVSKTGNVDSAKLLIEYGIRNTIDELKGKNNDLFFENNLILSILDCNINRLENEIVNNQLNLLNIALSDDKITPLLLAVYNDCYSIIKYLLKEGVYVDEVSLNGLTPLMVAASLGYINIIELLIKSGASINYKHKFAETTALHMASELGQIQSIIMLCELGANVNVYTSIGGTPLHTAAQVGTLDNRMMKSFLKHCPLVNINSLMNNDTTPLYLAAQYGFVTSVQALIKYGCDISFSMPNIISHSIEKFDTNKNAENINIINSEAGNGAEAIHAACENGHSEVVSALIEGGCNINSMSIGVSPLHLAVQYNQVRFFFNVLK